MPRYLGGLGFLIGVAASTLALGHSAHAQAGTERAQVMAALERLLLTGEPRHTSHHAGEWLQWAVDAAIARGDVDIERLARRAAVPLVVRLSAPVASAADLPGLTIDMPSVLRVPAPVTYRAEIAVSIDGGAWVPVGTFASPSSRGARIDRLLPAYVSQPGLHHLQARARITWEGGALPPEERHLPETVYAIYDPQEGSRFDARFFADSARTAATDRLDPTLPRAPLERWLLNVLGPHMAPDPPAIGWRVAYCDERLVERGTRPRTRDLCAVAAVVVKDGLSGVGEVWIRTGRIERRGAEYHWLADVRRVEAVVVRAMELEALSALRSAAIPAAATDPRRRRGTSARGVAPQLAR